MGSAIELRHDTEFPHSRGNVLFMRYCYMPIIGTIREMIDKTCDDAAASHGAAVSAASSDGFSDFVEPRQLPTVVVLGTPGAGKSTLLKLALLQLAPLLQARGVTTILQQETRATETETLTTYDIYSPNGNVEGGRRMDLLPEQGLLARPTTLYIVDGSVPLESICIVVLVRWKSSCKLLLV
jgi:hypothetical protein